MAILAQYTIRSKQAYIFRTNAMREISGASALIRDAWDLLFDKGGKQLKALRLKDTSNDDFVDDPDEAFNGDCQMIELFSGGGNITVLFKNEECLRKANEAFSRALLEQCPGMIPMCVSVKTTNDYKGDYKALWDASEREKNRMEPVQNLAMAPFSMMDQKTFRPITRLIEHGSDQREELTDEANAKRSKVNGDSRITKGNAVLDNIGSKLAVVHADGNNMGKKIKDLLGDETCYSRCVPLMRRFTRATAEAFTGEGDSQPKGKLDRYAKEMGEAAEARGERNDYIVRWIVNDGDDATFVCSANRALELTEVYLRAVLKQSVDISQKRFEYNSCAGICLFHSHYPYSMAYAMAEEACDSAKVKVHLPERDESWIDFHYIHSGLNDDLKDLRKIQGTLDRVARPWRVIEKTSTAPTSVKEAAAKEEGKGSGLILTTDNLRRLAELLRLFCGVTRTNIKTLGAAWERSKADGIREFERVCYHANNANKLKNDLKEMFGEDQKNWLKAIYDLSEVYDLWFAPKLEPLAEVVKILRESSQEELEAMIAALEEHPSLDAEKLQGHSSWVRIVSYYENPADGVRSGTEKATQRAQKAIEDLVETEGWTELLGRGK